MPTHKQQQKDKKIFELKQAMTDNGTDQQTKNLKLYPKTRLFLKHLKQL